MANNLPKLVYVPLSLNIFVQVFWQKCWTYFPQSEKLAILYHIVPKKTNDNLFNSGNFTTDGFNMIFFLSCFLTYSLLMLAWITIWTVINTSRLADGKKARNLHINKGIISVSASMVVLTSILLINSPGEIHGAAQAFLKTNIYFYTFFYSSVCYMLMLLIFLLLKLLVLRWREQAATAD